MRTAVDPLNSASTGRRIAGALLSFALSVVVVSCSRSDPQPGDSCTSLEDCVGTTALSCLQGSCVRQSCERSAECPLGAACVLGICQAPECAMAEDCPIRHRCWEGDCRADVCEFKAECEPGQVCTGEPPLCRTPPERCTIDDECPTDTHCKLPDQICEARCASDASCAAGSYCDGDFCRLECRDGADCSSEEVCIERRCAPDPCGDRTCAQDRPFLNPQTCECVACIDDSDCSVDGRERCSDAGRCLFCLLRSDDSTVCTQQGLRLLEGCCTECTADRDCPDGTHCEVGRCVVDDPRECVVDEDCPVDAACDAGWCVLPGSMAPCERQIDCATGEACYDDGRCRAEGETCGECPSPSRCVAEPGDSSGTCTGCAVSCDSSACSDGMTCFFPDAAVEGYCVAAELANCQ